MQEGIAIVTVLALAAMFWLGRLVYRHLEHRVARVEVHCRPELAAVTPPRGLLSRIFASAEDKHDSTRLWLGRIVPLLIAAAFGQLLNLGGCNTTPTQTRLDRDEATIHQLSEDIVSRKELEDHWAAIAKIQDQRDKRIDRIEQQQDHNTMELMDVLQKGR